ncbi:hypothetical protein SYNPS1DRAFT_27869 [Syncephalis pseudoplumigaleata]|uniref:Uncharacterized protein n=1 Tax=Syncephalis pseudoplumigaleata TaxID=1712513 RepID=A0A4P9Z267_9FUNG|nr:hypothetical protein SYNPS1DRAFT_27869 [Syncephalis pseudoplumigaleata]|eukprot:RKP26438.1 hypothetical protein SYNPS1DRAFT_27869 [Syncephalis pseudoplumigaleata]
MAIRWFSDTFWEGLAAVGLASSYPAHLPSADYHPAIIITGTSSGIGKEAALTFARQGYTVLATVRQERHAEMLSSAFEAQLQSAANDSDAAPLVPGGSLHAVLMDLAGKEEIAQGWERIEAVLRRTDAPLVALINNAGHGVSRVSELMSTEDWLHSLWTNFLGAIELTRLALPRLRATKGRVVNIGSMMAWFSMPCCSSYSACKAALALWTRTLRSELAPFEVAVTNIEPGGVNTPGPARSVSDLAGELDHGQHDEHPVEYRRMAQGLRRTLEPRQGSGMHPRYVVDAMAHALQSPVPRDRYYVGIDAHLLACFAWLFGEAAIDGLWRRMIAGNSA